MRFVSLFFVVIFALTVNIFAQGGNLAVEGEKRIKNIKQLTFGGENAEAYWSSDGKKLTFQSKRDGHGCDQIYTMNADGTGTKMISNGEGRTTCSYFFNKNKNILYGSTHLGAKECPPNPDFSKGYVWAIYPTYDIFSATADGKNIKQLTNSPGYDAEATVSPDGKKVIFTSMRDGDLDLYVMDTKGKNVKRLTTELGYDGGAFFSPDGKQIVYRSYHPKTAAEIARYKDRLANNLIEPTVFEVWVMNADGTNKRQVTKLGAASFAPFFTPDGKKIIFCTNNFASDPRKRNFDLALINVDGTGLERVTYNETFDGFPMFSPDGKKLVFASNRNAAKEGDTNVFVADWVN
ncbi:MAG: PD40 domain-containing protein [Pyrinomonadaceae bacterium]|nr:PD40 domain-containing protein [Blastocatellia bacterium]MCW5956873.1 PD40 domain-containing protein [Pyrinomonadaceae bacterium]